MAAQQVGDLDLNDNSIVNSGDGDITIKLGDAASANRLRVRNNVDTVVFQIDSLGRVVSVNVPEVAPASGDLVLFEDSDGVIKGVDIADIVPANTAYVSSRAELDTALADSTIKEIVLSSGTFDLTTDSISFSRGDFSIRGAGKPRHSSGSLLGGTVVIGGFDLNDNNRIGISDLGIDVSGTTGSVNGVEFGGTSGDGHQIRNVAALGKDVAHAYLANTGANHHFENISAWNFDHGLIFKCSDSIASNLYFENIDIYAVGFVADLRDVENNLVTNTNAKSCGRGVAYESDGNWCRYNNVVNVVDDSCAYGVTFVDQTAAGSTTAEDNKVMSGQSNGATTMTVRWENVGSRNVLIGFDVLDAAHSFVAVGATVEAELRACSSTNPTGVHSAAYTSSVFNVYDVIEDGVPPSSGGGTIIDRYMWSYDEYDAAAKVIKQKACAAGTMTAVRIVADTAPTGGESWTVFKEGSTTGQSVTLASTATEEDDTSVGSVTFAAGDTIHVDPTSSPSTPSTWGSIVVEITRS